MGRARGVLAVVAALLLPACNITYVPDLVAPDINATPPPPYILVLPLNDELQAPTNPQFAWNALAGVTFYQLQISTASDFSEIVWDDATLTTTSTFLTQVTLTNFTTYYWRIYGLQGGGVKALAGGSPFQFRTQGGGVTIPVPFFTQFPMNGLTGVPVKPPFAWQGSIGASAYQIEIDVAGGKFSPPLFVQPDIHVNRFTWVTPLSSNTTYLWRVLATGQLGNRYSDPVAAAFTTAP